MKEKKKQPAEVKKKKKKKTQEIKTINANPVSNLKRQAVDKGGLS